MNSYGRYQKQRGLAMVEFAIVLPILLIILFMVAEIGRALYQYNTLSKAVGDAARHFSVHHAAVDGDDQVINRVRCGWLDADGCSQPSDLLITGLATTDDIVVELARLDCDSAASIDDCSENATNYDHVMIHAYFVYQPITGQILPNLLNAAFDLNLELTATVVMRAL
jgi:Flp pilus assembly protein TadG